MTIRKTMVFLLALWMFASGCSQPDPVNTDPVTAKPTVTVIPSDPTATPESGNLPLYKDPSASVDLRVHDLLSRMSLDEKLGQMIQAEASFIRPEEVAMHYIGSVLSGGGHAPGNKTADAWKDMVSEYQRAAASTPLGIPILYGVDAVHGMAKYKDVVVFPHNSGLGAANNSDLMERIGMKTAEEMLLSGVTWNFGPCVAVAQDIRWGRTYESYSQNPDRVSSLARSYIKGLKSYQMVVSAKHFLGDGGTEWGTGDNGYLIDRGQLTASGDAELEKHLAPYKEAIIAGARTIMVSFSSLNGVKMHENAPWVQKWLKDRMGFTGFVVSDWEGLQEIHAASYHDQLVKAVNSGVDMLMEPDDWRDALNELKNAVNTEEISTKRIDDAVGRILRVKLESGLFEYPTGCYEAEQGDVMHEASLVAQEAVSESLVLLKNENNALPLRKDAKLMVLGDAADDLAMQCGGWTMEWQGLYPGTADKYLTGKTILEALTDMASQNGGKVYTDISDASQADAVVLVLGEVPYAEGVGDDANLDLYSGTAYAGNKEAVKAARSTGLPIITLLVAGRPRLVTQELSDWDAFVMAWLPGTEGQGVSQVLYGEKPFTGTLPFTWPRSMAYFNSQSDTDILFEYGYGLTD